MNKGMVDMIDEEAAALTPDDVAVLRHLARESLALAKNVIRRFPRAREVARDHLRNAIHWCDLANSAEREHRRTVNPVAAALDALDRVDATLAELGRVTLPLFGGRDG